MIFRRIVLGETLSIRPSPCHIFLRPLASKPRAWGRNESWALRCRLQNEKPFTNSPTPTNAGRDWIVQEKKRLLCKKIRLEAELQYLDKCLDCLAPSTSIIVDTTKPLTGDSKHTTNAVEGEENNEAVDDKNDLATKKHGRGGPGISCIDTLNIYLDPRT